MTLRLERDGGRLLARLEPMAAGQTAYLFHAGFVEPLPFAQSWAALQGGVNGSEADVTLALMEAGAYALCVAEPRLVPELLRGARPARHCVSGTLPAGGELNLVVPSEAPGERAGAP